MVLNLLHLSWTGQREAAVNTTGTRLTLLFLASTKMAKSEMYLVLVY
jgi:hypothetical protein